MVMNGHLVSHIYVEFFIYLLFHVLIYVDNTCTYIFISLKYYKSSRTCLKS